MKECNVRARLSADPNSRNPTAPITSLLAANTHRLPVWSETMAPGPLLQHSSLHTASLSCQCASGSGHEPSTLRVLLTLIALLTASPSALKFIASCYGRILACSRLCCRRLHRCNGLTQSHSSRLSAVAIYIPIGVSIGIHTQSTHSKC